MHEFVTSRATKLNKEINRFINEQFSDNLFSSYILNVGKICIGSRITKRRQKKLNDAKKEQDKKPSVMLTNNSDCKVSKYKA